MKPLLLHLVLRPKHNFLETRTFTNSEDEFEMCTIARTGCCLPFDPSALEGIILKISDSFDLRVMLSNRKTQGALLVTTGLAIAGGLVGNRYGGKVGAAVGGAVGGAIGLGVVAVSMREVWEDIKSKLADLYEVVYDYLAGLGIEDYKRAALFLTQNNPDASQLASVVMQMASQLLGTKVVSSLINS